MTASAMEQSRGIIRQGDVLSIIGDANSELGKRGGRPAARLACPFVLVFCLHNHPCYVSSMLRCDSLQCNYNGCDNTCDYPAEQKPDLAKARAGWAVSVALHSDLVRTTQCSARCQRLTVDRPIDWVRDAVRTASARTCIPSQRPRSQPQGTFQCRTTKTITVVEITGG